MEPNTNTETNNEPVRQSKQESNSKYRSKHQSDLNSKVKAAYWANPAVREKKLQMMKLYREKKREELLASRLAEVQITPPPPPKTPKEMENMEKEYRAYYNQKQKDKYHSDPEFRAKKLAAAKLNRKAKKAEAEVEVEEDEDEAEADAEEVEVEDKVEEDEIIDTFLSNTRT